MSNSSRALQILFLLNLALCDFYKTYSNSQRDKDIFTRDPFLPIDLTFITSHFVKKYYQKPLLNYKVAFNLKDSELKCFLLKKESESKHFIRLLRDFSPKTLLKTTYTVDTSSLPKELESKTKNGSGTREKDEFVTDLDTFYDYEEYNEGEKVEGDKLLELFTSFLSYDTVIENVDGEDHLVLSLGKKMKSRERLDTIYKRAFDHLNGKCFKWRGNPNGKNSFCLFKGITFNGDFYIFIEPESIKEAFLQYPQYELKFKLFLKGNSFQGAKEAKFLTVFLICGQDDTYVSNYNSKNNQFVLYTNTLCINEKGFRKIFEYVENDPKKAKEYIRHNFYKECDLLRIGDIDYVYCSGDIFHKTDMDDTKTILGFYQENSTKAKLTRIGGDRETSMLSFDLEHGEDCKEGKNGEKYQTKITYICYKEVTLRRNFKILSVSKVGNCFYAVRIGSRGICNHKFFNTDENLSKEILCIYRKK